MLSVTVKALVEVNPAATHSISSGVLASSSYYLSIDTCHTFPCTSSVLVVHKRQVTAKLCLHIERFVSNPSGAYVFLFRFRIHETDARARRNDGGHTVPRHSRQSRSIDHCSTANIDMEELAAAFGRMTFAETTTNTRQPDAKAPFPFMKNGPDDQSQDVPNPREGVRKLSRGLQAGGWKT
jgi:hypothetical protein